MLSQALSMYLQNDLKKIKQEEEKHFLYNLELLPGSYNISSFSAHLLLSKYGMFKNKSDDEQQQKHKETELPKLCTYVKNM